MHWLQLFFSSIFDSSANVQILHKIILRLYDFGICLLVWLHDSFI